jgi:opacity protein-like surface antigen
VLNRQITTLNDVRNTIYAPTGTAPTTMSRETIESLPQGANAPLDKVLLQFPGVSQDSAASGLLHVRNEHANVSYRINGILLPDGLAGLGQLIDTSFVGSLTLITGALPVQYGLRTAGVVDIQTSGSAFNNTGSVGVYGGSRETRVGSFEYGGRSGSTEFFFTGRYTQNILGIENPTASVNAIHDFTQQGRGFAYVSNVIDPYTRLTFIGGSAMSNFQIPNRPGQAPSFTAFGQTFFDSANLDERQKELYQFGILALQKSIANVDIQLSYFTRTATVHFTPDPIGDLMFNGSATDVSRYSLLNGISGDVAIKFNEAHTLRTGMFVSAEKTTVTNISSLLPIDATTGNQISDIPFSVTDSSSLLGWLASVYLSDEWRITDKLTLVYGGRFDQMWQYQNANQFSPRISVVYKPYESTTFHAGYARYFTPPVQVIAAPTNTALFTSCPGIPNCTTTQAPSQPPPYNPMLPERAHVFDIGVVQKVSPRLELGVDAYWKRATELIDDGQFGTAVVLNGFNYAQGQNIGVEMKAVYTNGNFRAYANWAWANQRAFNRNTNQFLFAPADLAFGQTNWIYTDHTQIWTGSGGMSYLWNGTRLSADIIYGSGLRAGDFNTDHNAPYYQVNTGVSREFQFSNWSPITARFDIINLFDVSYALRNGTGIGVFAPQFGPRRGFYVGLSQKFGQGTVGIKPPAAVSYPALAKARTGDKSPMFTKAPIATWTWGGFYIGANAGFGLARSRTDALFSSAITAAPLSASSGSADLSSAVFGAQAGYNWQWGRWVAGVEADLQGPSKRTIPSFACPGAVCNPGGNGGPVTFDYDHKLDWFGTVRGRFGTTVTPDVLAYATGGLAVAGVSHFGWINPDQIFDGNSANVLGRTLRYGWALGGGVEARLLGNWIGRLEYLHLDLGKHSIGGIDAQIAPALALELQSRVTDDIVRLGINYKFEDEPPASAPFTKARGSKLARLDKSPVFLKAPAPAAWTWDGYYLGLNGGYSWGRSRTDGVFTDLTLGGDLFATGSTFDLKGILLGAQTGYNWQIGRWVAGIEGDVALTGQRGNPSFICPGTTCNPNGQVVATFDQNQQLEWFATLRGRFGVTVVPDALLYVTGGIAVGGFKTAGDVYGFDPTGVPAVVPFLHLSTVPGWVAGAGIEGHLAGNWTGKVEYLHLDFMPISASAGNQLNMTLVTAFSSRISDDLLRAGFNYKFDWEGPVSVK